MKTLAFSVLTLSIFLTACVDPASNKPHAQTSNVATNAAIDTQPSNADSARTESLSVTPENSKVLFIAAKVTRQHDGGFNRFNGTITLVNEKPEESKVSVDIETASVFTDTPDLTKHLQTADFFDVAKFPKATFTSTTIVPDAAKGANNYTVTGHLDLHGQKKSVIFPATINIGADDVSVNAEFAINRKDFGIVYPGFANDLIRDDVVIKLDLKSPRKK
jgi:polyisoprenoid-binding protein YceI